MARANATGLARNARRCGARTKRPPYGPCDRIPKKGAKRCPIHGGESPPERARYELVAMREGLARYVTPISEDDPEADPYVSFSMEFRRTIAHIRYYEEKIASLSKESDLVWGKTKSESVTATEYAGVNTTLEAKTHIYEQACFRERQHLTDLHKIWIGAKLDAKKLEIEQGLIDRIDLTLNSILKGLGKDPDDPEVRKIMREGLLALA